MNPEPRDQIPGWEGTVGPFPKDYNPSCEHHRYHPIAAGTVEHCVPV